MAKKKIENVEIIKKEIKPKEFYKGYSIKWLRNETNHPDYYLVKEFDELNGIEEIKEIEEVKE